jgi:membrane-associated phospholipid phosphatase
MPKKFIARTALIALLLLLCLVAGLVGGIGFAPDVTLIRQLQLVRADAPGVTLAAIAVTQAGSAYGTVGGGLGVAAWLAWRRQRWLAAVLGATVLGERLVIDGMKLLIDRHAPSVDLHPVVTHSSSFPSGHAGNSMAVFLSIALIAVPRAHRDPGGDHRRVRQPARRQHAPLPRRALAKRRDRRLVARRGDRDHRLVDRRRRGSAAAQQQH